MAFTETWLVGNNRHLHDIPGYYYHLVRRTRIQGVSGFGSNKVQIRNYKWLNGKREYRKVTVKIFSDIFY